MNYGEIIRRVRLERNVPATQVAKVLQLGYSNYWRLEQGDTALSFERFMVIADALGMSPEELVKELKKAG